MVIDVVDIGDKSLLENEVAELRAKGRSVIMHKGVPGNAVRQMIYSVIRTAKIPGSITLLRLHGHGLPGLMGVSIGNRMKRSDFQNGAPIFISDTNVNTFAADFAKLRPYFAGGGRIELMGCYVAQGSAGATLLKSMARMIGVPVSGGSQIQYAGGNLTLAIEGPVFTAYPDGTLKQQKDFLRF